MRAHQLAVASGHSLSECGAVGRPARADRPAARASPSRTISDSMSRCARPRRCESRRRGDAGRHSADRRRRGSSASRSGAVRSRYRPGRPAAVRRCRGRRRPRTAAGRRRIELELLGDRGRDGERRSAVSQALSGWRQARRWPRSEGQGIARDQAFDRLGGGPRLVLGSAARSALLVFADAGSRTQTSASRSAAAPRSGSAAAWRPSATARTLGAACAAWHSRRRRFS